MAQGAKPAVGEAMKNDGEEEARLAKESRDVDDEGYPLVTVTADGAWPKRSYKNKYDAASGLVSTVFARI